jgi:hypothetical protein
MICYLHIKYNFFGPILMFWVLFEFLLRSILNDFENNLDCILVFLACFIFLLSSNVLKNILISYFSFLFFFVQVLYEKVTQQIKSM